MNWTRSSGVLLACVLLACSGPDGDDGAALGTGTGGASPGVGGAGPLGVGGGSFTGGVGGVAMGGAMASGGALPQVGGANAMGGNLAGGSSGGGSSGGGSSGGGSSGAGGEPTATGGVGGSQEMCSDELPALGCDTLGTWGSEMAAAEEEILLLVNAVRASGTTCGGAERPAVPPLAMDETLRCAARLHSQDMAERSFFSHGTYNPSGCPCQKDGDCGGGLMCTEGPMADPEMRCGKTPFRRMQEVGASFQTAGENVAAGNDTAEETMAQWLNSAGHCDNIMSGAFSKLGVGYAQGGPYGHYWTQAFSN